MSDQPSSVGVPPLARGATYKLPRKLYHLTACIQGDSDYYVDSTYG
jgi:hypothetical protein